VALVTHTALADGFFATFATFRRGFKTVREMEYKVADGDDPQYNFKTWFMIREPLPLPAVPGTDEREG
jgi:hypothetical protein